MIGTAYPRALCCRPQAESRLRDPAITTGSLPAGLTLNASTGGLRGGERNVTSTTKLTVTVTDNESPTKKTATANLSMAVSAPALSVKTTSLAGGTVGNAYTNQRLGRPPAESRLTPGLSPPAAFPSVSVSTPQQERSPEHPAELLSVLTVSPSPQPTPGTAATANANLSVPKGRCAGRHNFQLPDRRRRRFPPIAARVCRPLAVSSLLPHCRHHRQLAGGSES